MVSQDSMCTAAREASAAVPSYSREQRAAACGVRHNVQTGMKWSGNKIKISCQSEPQKKSPHPKHPRLKNHFIISRNLMLLVACCDKHIYLYLWHAQYAAHTAPTHLPAGIEGVRTHASTSLSRMSTGGFFIASKCDWCSRSLKKTR